MAHRRKFTAEFKAQVVLDLVSGAKSAAELCRQHQLNPQLPARWKTECLLRAPPAVSAIGRFLDEVYRHKCMHCSLGYLTPAEFESPWRHKQAHQHADLAMLE